MDVFVEVYPRSQPGGRVFFNARGYSRTPRCTPVFLLDMWGVASQVRSERKGGQFRVPISPVDLAEEDLRSVHYPFLCATDECV
jgi:hypothetical protein